MDFFKGIANKAQQIILEQTSPTTKKPSKHELIQREYNLPPEEHIVDQSSAEITIITKFARARLANSNNNNNSDSNQEPFNGKLTLTNNFLVFKDSYDSMICSFAIVLPTIQKIQRVHRSYDFAIMLLTTNDLEITVQFVGIKSQCERFGQNLVKLLKKSLEEVDKMNDFQCNLYSEYLLYKNHSSNFEIMAPPPGGLGWVFKFPGNSQKLNDRLKMKKWFDYFRENGRNFALVRNITFFKLVSYGLPNKLRGELWETCCGSLFLRYEYSDEYNRLLVDHDGETSTAIEEIEKDLNRSLPEYPAYQTDEGINRLRRVLTAYSWKNPEVGYCQAMNIVTAALLIYMSEEQVFWCLNVLCDKIIPGYYSRTMYGVLLDQKVFEGLVNKALPMIGEHFAKHDIQLSIVSLPWFLSFFLNTMPLIYAFRVIDMLLLHGPRVLFQIGLAVIRVNGETLLQCDDDGECIAVFKDFFATLEQPQPSFLNKDKMRTKFDNLWEVAFREFVVVGDKSIEQMRMKFKNEVFQGIETFVKRTELRNLPKTPNLTGDQVSNVYDRYYGVLINDAQAPSTGSITMDFDSFEVFMSRLVDWTDASKKSPEQTKFLKRLYSNWSSNDGIMSLETLIVGLNKLLDHDIMNSLSNFIAMYDEKKDGKINRESVLQLAEDLIFITSPWRDGLLFDEITNKSIESEIARKIYERKLILKEQGIDTPDDEIRLPTEVRFNEDKWKGKQLERYLASGSNFLQMAFKYAQPLEDPKEPLIDLGDNEKEVDIPPTPPSIKMKNDSDSRDSHNAALDPSHPTYITPSTFRMVILADETYESFFHDQFWRSFHVDEKVNENLGMVNNIRGMFDNFLADGRRVAIEVRKRMDDASKTISGDNSSIGSGGTQNARSSRAQTVSSLGEDEDDDFGNFVTPAGDVLGDVPVGADVSGVLHDRKEIENERKLANQMNLTNLN